jgi:hypothetical protein
MHRTLDFAALEVLRALFDLAEADLRPSLDLLGRLFHLEPHACSALIAQLRVAKLLQNDRLCLTMAGLAVASALPITEPRSLCVAVVPALRAA